MKLNCDLGEGHSEVDSLIMPFIDMANIACGGHVGDKRSMSKAVQLATSHNVIIGAHPSYPDPDNFGRQVFQIRQSQLYDSLSFQVAALHELCAEQNTQIQYIKPHGQLYHDICHSPDIRATVLSLAQKKQLPLMVIAQTQSSLVREAQMRGVNLIYEAFADRSYTDDAQLVNRKHANALHQTLDQIVEQAKHLINKHGLYTQSKNWLALNAESLCVHGDGDLAMASVRAIRHLLTLKNNIDI